MVLTKERFRLYELNEDKQQDVVSLKMNKEEREMLEADKVTLQQEKDGTALKQLWAIGRKVIHDTPEGVFFKLYLDNLRKNKRIGIVEVEQKTKQK
jgi:hypothetical protein